MAAASSGFPWGAAMQLGTTLVGNYYNRGVGRINYQMQVMQHNAAASQFAYQQRIGAAAHGVAVAQAQAQNQMVDAQNQIARVEAGMANFMTAENNRRRLQAAGAMIDAAQVTLARQRDVGVAEDLEAQLGEAEAMGAYAANAALAGVSGASVDAIESAMRLKAARAEQYRGRQQYQLDYDAAAQIAGLKAAQYTELDRTVAIPGMNFSHASAGIFTPGVFNAERPRMPNLGNLGTDLIGWALGNQTAAGQLADWGGSFFKRNTRPALPFSDTGDY